MSAQTLSSSSRRQTAYVRRASVTVQFAMFGSLVGVGVAALAVDTGLMFAARQELQNAADAAALAAASQLGAGTEAASAAVQQAADYAAHNKVDGDHLEMLSTDVVFGHATLGDNNKYVFYANTEPYDAVQVKVRRDATVQDGPVSLLFARTFGADSTDLTANAVAMVVPRDIAVVVDLSGSMNDDSEIRHSNTYSSESGGENPGVQVNLEDVWLALPCAKGNNGVGNGIDPQPPGNPSNLNDQPGTGPGSPNSQGGNPSPGAEPTGPNGACGGPRWGWMTGWGNAIVLGSYSPVGDPGLYYIPKGTTTTDPDVASNLAEAGYASTEQAALKSSLFDGTTTYYRNRVKVMLGVVGWRSKHTDSKYSGGPGNRDDKVDDNELHQEIDFPYPGGTWNGYIDYMTNTSAMRDTSPDFRYRYGLKTMTNYFLEKLANHNSCPDLTAAPEMPLHSVKDAVQVLVDTVNGLETDDHISLEVFATSGRHEVSLASPGPGESLAALRQVIPDTLKQRQAGHYDSTTNAGAGLDKGAAELVSSRARSSAAKVMIFLSDGKPNVDANGQSVGNSSPAAVEWAEERAEYAASKNITIYTIGVGGDANDGFLQNIAEIGHGEYFFADNTPDPVTGQPMYVTELIHIFENLGGRRPVRLIQ